MVKPRKKKSGLKSYNKKFYIFNYKKRHFKVLLDNVLIFGLLKKLHGRFWGIASIMIFSAGLAICFIIRPEMFKLSTAFSDFGSDIRTVPYFTCAVFFSTYGLWRWRNYLSRTLKRTKPIIALMTFTIIGLYVVALMPSSWYGLPRTMHFIGFSIVGISVATMVVLDILLSKTRKNHSAYQTKMVKSLSFFLIITGSVLTIMSLKRFGWLDISLVGEMMMLAGFAIWIITKTYQGEEPRSYLSRLLRKVVLID
jgi:hypothetical protein